MVADCGKPNAFRPLPLSEKKYEQSMEWFLVVERRPCRKDREGLKPSVAFR